MESWKIEPLIFFVWLIKRKFSKLFDALFHLIGPSIKYVNKVFQNFMIKDREGTQ